MKYFILVCIMLGLPALAASQDSINPYSTGQHNNIILQHTDVYYRPYLPPASTDNRGQLSCLAFELRDPNGLRQEINYDPMTHGHHLSYYVGQNALWMRLFTAALKANDSVSNIIVGDSVTSDTAATHGYGEVTIDSLEDVDFNASGTIEMESGFHVMPGASFHAYIEPKWTGTCATAGDSGNGLVFCDEFNDSAISQWSVGNGYSAPSGLGGDGANCYASTNVVDTLDVDANDGHALRLDLKYDSCNCMDQSFSPAALPSTDTNFQGLYNHGCDEIDYWDIIKHPHGINNTFQFSSGVVQTCPFPFTGHTIPLQPVYQNIPYGKYEIRSKVPHVMHHESNWGSAEGNDWTTDEVTESQLYGLSLIRPYLSHIFVYGPYKGIFKKHPGSDTVFFSSGARFTQYNIPRNLVINGILYSCYLSVDTVKFYATTQREGGVPPSLANDTTDSITFYYQRSTSNTSDTVRWSIDSTGRYFTGPYGVPSPGDSLFFTKGYQPTSIVLPVGFSADTTLSCRWDSASGKIYLNTSFPSGASHSRTTNFTYTVDEGPAYPYPSVPMDTTGYVYQTYTMEWFPHECEILVDGIVISRFPDRMVPVSDIRYDYMSTYPRVPSEFYIGELDIDGGTGYATSSSYTTEKAFFLSNRATAPGCWNNAAHDLIDYVKIWDLPAGSSVSPIRP